MDISDIDQQKITARAIELMGGKDAFFNAADQELEKIHTQWNQNIELIGRILRAHLFVEHYMTEYLAKTNPRLGDLNQARLSFSQKTELLEPSNPDMADIVPGIKRLNRIRNRLAHKLNVQVTEEDSSFFLKSERFAALRSVREREKPLSTDPLDILEDFAQYTSTVFNYEFTPLSRAISQAIAEMHANRAN
ncbi:MAG TPA: hypothetical protein VK959_04985 [Methylophilaceae bacterium]|nr:hypothetical protein [Methylophilaceae bacterium]